MKNLKSKVLGFLVAFGVTLGLGVAVAQYVGYNPTTNLVGVPGLPYALGQVPTVDATTTCGTVSTIQSSIVGGLSVFQFTAGATTCTIKLDIPTITVNGVTTQPAAPNGLFCVASDETTPADSLKQSAHSTTSCTLTGTVVSSDHIVVEINGF